MIIRKFIEIDENGKTIGESTWNQDTAALEPHIDEKKRTEVAATAETSDIQAKILKGNISTNSELIRVAKTVNYPKNKQLRETIYYYKNRTKSYDAQLYTIILEDPNDSSKRLYYTGGDINPKNKAPVRKFDLIASKKSVSLENHYKILSTHLETSKNAGDLDEIMQPLSTEFVQFTSMLKEYVDLGLTGNQMALLGDLNGWNCLTGLISLGDCLLATGTALTLCPLCIQVVTCVPACLDIFTLPVCLLCEGTGLGGCAVCLIAGYVCYHAAEKVHNNCF